MNLSHTQTLPNQHWGASPFPDPSRMATQTHTMGKKGILIAFRFLVFLAVVVMLFFKDIHGESFFSSQMMTLLTFYFLSIAVMTALKSAWVENKYVLSAVFLADTFFVSAGIYLGGVTDVNLFLIFFTTIFISSLSQEITSVFAIATVS